MHPEQDMGSALAYAIASAGSDAVTLAPSFTVGGETPYFGSRTVFTLFFAPAAIAFDLPCLPRSHSSLRLRSKAHPMFLQQLFVSNDLLVYAGLRI